jgi:hypothetical protein
MGALGQATGSTASLPITVQRWVRQQTTKLASTTAHERDEVFRNICADARTVDEPAHHGNLAAALFLMGKHFLINRSEESIRSTVIGELNKIIPFATRTRAAPASYVTEAYKRTNGPAASTIAAFKHLVEQGDPTRLEVWLARHPADEIARLLELLDAKR